MDQHKRCKDCKHYKECCFSKDLKKSQWYMYHHVNKGTGDCWESNKKGDCRKCPMYNSTWDCDRHCFSDPVGSVRVVKAWKERHGK